MRRNNIVVGQEIERQIQGFEEQCQTVVLVAVNGEIRGYITSQVCIKQEQIGTFY